MFSFEVELNCQKRLYFRPETQDSTVWQRLLVSGYNVITYHDEFYDTDHLLRASARWLSKRDGCWRMKRIVNRVGGSIVFCQLVGEDAIVADLEAMLGRPVSLDSFQRYAALSTYECYIDARFGNKKYYPVLSRDSDLDERRYPMVPAASKIFALESNCADTIALQDLTLDVVQALAPRQEQYYLLRQVFLPWRTRLLASAVDPF